MRLSFQLENQFWSSIDEPYEFRVSRGGERMECSKITDEDEEGKAKNEISTKKFSLLLSVYSDHHASLRLGDAIQNRGES